MSDRAQGGVAGWTVEQHLAFDIGFALPRAPIKGFRKALTEDERRVIAKSIVEHLKLCGWPFQMLPIAVGHETRSRASPGRGDRPDSEPDHRPSTSAQYLQQASNGFFAMPRQPFLPFLLKNRNGQFNVGTHALRQRPEIELLIAHCLMAWPPAEAEMALLLAHLLGAEQSEATLAVFQSLRRSSAQRDALKEAGRTTLSDADQELLNAILNAHKAIESERNALTHGHFGIYSLLLDGVVWMDTKSFIDTKVRGELGHQVMNEEFLIKMYSNVYVYKSPDVQTVFEDIKDIADIWNNFTHYLRVHSSLPVAAGLYRQLCDRPRIAQELAMLRQKIGRGAAQIVDSGRRKKSGGSEDEQHGPA
jgi:hypothetical protein